MTFISNNNMLFIVLKLILLNIRNNVTGKTISCEEQKTIKYETKLYFSHSIYLITVENTIVLIFHQFLT